MDRWLNSSTVVFVWAAFNTLLSFILAGFTASGFIGGPGGPGVLAYASYAISVGITLAAGLLVWLGRRRQGLRLPPRPASALLLATAVSVCWLGLAFGIWLAVIGGTVFLAAVILLLYPRERP